MDEKDKKPQAEFNYDEFIDGEFNVELSEPRQRAILSRLYGEKKKTLNKCPHDDGRPCCEYCPIKHSADAKGCEEIYSCADMFAEIAGENAYLKKQIELERWRIGQIKQLFDNQEHSELRKLVLSYASLYDSEAEDVRRKRLIDVERRVEQKKAKLCEKLKDVMPVTKEPSGKFAPYYYFDDKGKLQTVMVAEEMAEQLRNMDRIAYNSDKKYSSKLVDFGFDPFNTDFMNFEGQRDENAENFHGSIFGYGAIDKDRRAQLLQIIQGYNDAYNRLRKRRIREQLRDILQNGLWADSYYFFVYQHESKTKIGIRLGISNVMVGKYIKQAKEVEAEYGLDRLGLSEAEERQYQKFIENVKKKFGEE